MSRFLASIFALLILSDLALASSSVVRAKGRTKPTLKSRQRVTLKKHKPLVLKLRKSASLDTSKLVFKFKRSITGSQKVEASPIGVEEVVISPEIGKRSVTETRYEYEIDDEDIEDEVEDQTQEQFDADGFNFNFDSDGLMDESDHLDFDNLTHFFNSNLTEQDFISNFSNLIEGQEDSEISIDKVN